MCRRVFYPEKYVGRKLQGHRYRATTRDNGAEKFVEFVLYFIASWIMEATSEEAILCCHFSLGGLLLTSARALGEQIPTNRWKIFWFTDLSSFLGFCLGWKNFDRQRFTTIEWKLLITKNNLCNQRCINNIILCIEVTH